MFLFDQAAGARNHQKREIIKSSRGIGSLDLARATAYERRRSDAQRSDADRAWLGSRG